MVKQFIVEAARMQKLAGIITENETNSDYLSQKSRAKEWLENTFSGEPEIDHEVEEKVDILLNSNNQMTKDLFKKIWAAYTNKYSTGDVGAEWDTFEPTFMWVMDGDESHFENY